MARITVPEADAVIDEAFPVLDQGFVRLVDYMGGDARVVQAARVSYGTGTKTVREDKGLIGYLMRNAHTSPFEQVSLVFHIKLPLFVFAQMVRHRTAKLNSMSARYSVMQDEFYLPTADQIRGQSLTNKQVSEGGVGGEAAGQAAGVMQEQARVAYALYEEMLANGVGREQARMVLPQNLYTQIYWKCDLHNLFHFLRLRLDWHAQQEIRAYGEVMAMLTKLVAPFCYEAFEEHILNAQRFGGSEVEALKRLLAGEPHGLEGRAGSEFEAKLGLTPAAH
ncbi:MAG: Thymidylate synthase thyX [Cyanobacteria bacterium RYN_339]|nr:Thymidylate synthase thyX [Cyanobacteria bacterium RYN_339]